MPGGTIRKKNERIWSRSTTMYSDRISTMSRLPSAPRLATASDWTGPASWAAYVARLSRKLVAWATRSTWSSPTALRRSCHAASSTGRSPRRLGTFAMNDVIDWASAPATRTTTRTIAPTIVAYTSTTAPIRGRIGTRRVRPATTGLRMKASSQARKKTRITSPRAKNTLARISIATIARTIAPSTSTAVSQRRCRSVTRIILERSSTRGPW